MHEAGKLPVEELLVKNIFSILFVLLSFNKPERLIFSLLPIVRIILKWAVYFFLAYAELLSYGLNIKLVALFLH